MARKARLEKPKVHCADCIHFERDNCGHSRSAVTGEYFMGACRVGISTDGIRKQFADKPRYCELFKNKKV